MRSCITLLVAKDEVKLLAVSFCYNVIGNYSIVMEIENQLCKSETSYLLMQISISTILAKCGSF